MPTERRPLPPWLLAILYGLWGLGLFTLPIWRFLDVTISGRHFRLAYVLMAFLGLLVLAVRPGEVWRDLLARRLALVSWVVFTLYAAALTFTCFLPQHHAVHSALLAGTILLAVVITQGLHRIHGPLLLHTSMATVGLHALINVYNFISTQWFAAKGAIGYVTLLDGIPRASGLLKEPSYFGLYFSLILLFIVFHPGLSLRVRLPFFFAVWLSAMLGMSRLIFLLTPFMAVAGLLACRHLLRTKFLVSLLIAGGLLLGVAALFVAREPGRIRPLLNSDSFAERKRDWSENLVVFMRNPWIGVGGDSSKSWHLRKVERRYPWRVHGPIGNQFSLEILSEYGILGGSLLALLIAGFFLRFPMDRAITMGILLGINSLFLGFAPRWDLWFPLALLWTLHGPGQAPPKPPPPPPT